MQYLLVSILNGMKSFGCGIYLLSKCSIRSHHRYIHLSLSQGFYAIYISCSWHPNDFIPFNIETSKYCIQVHPPTTPAPVIWDSFTFKVCISLDPRTFGCGNTDNERHLPNHTYTLRPPL